VTELIRATHNDRALVVSILVEAFEPLTEDNSINLIARNDNKRGKRMQILMSYLFDKAMRTGEVLLSDNRGSCLLISYEDKTLLSWASIKADIHLGIHAIGIKRLFQVIKRQRIVKRNYPKTNHIRPLILAVKNEYKGTVTAAKLVLQVFKDFENNTLPIIVDTASEEHVKLYQKFGLKVFNTEDELGFPIYLLRMN
jgi:hypothetical protein